MPFIDVDTSGAVEPKPVPAGVYDLVVAEADGNAKSQAGNPQVVVSIGIDGHDDAQNIRHYISLPVKGEPGEKAKFKVLFLRRFTDLFGIKLDPSGFDTDKLAMELVGRRAKCEVSLTEPDDDGNVYNRLVLPKLKDEGAPRAATPKPPKR